MKKIFVSKNKIYWDFGRKSIGIVTAIALLILLIFVVIPLAAFVLKLLFSILSILLGATISIISTILVLMILGYVIGNLLFNKKR